MNLKQLSTLVLIVLTAGACSLKTSGTLTDKTGRGGGNNTESLEFSTTNVTHVNKYFPSLAVATGLSATYLNNANIRNASGVYRTALSSSGNAMGFTTQMAVASLSVVITFCREAATRELNLGDPAKVMYPGIALNVAMPAGGFPDADLQKIVTNSWMRFRGSDEVPADVLASTVASLKSIYGELPATAANNATTASKANALGARSIAESGCIIIGAAWGSVSDSI